LDERKLGDVKLDKATKGNLYYAEVKRVSFFLGKARKIFETIEQGCFPEPEKEQISDLYDEYAWHWPSSK
jgi:hypothetical protein